MVPYIETFKVPHLGEFGIEDYEDGRPIEEHFFGKDYVRGKSHRYRIWWNGGGCGLSSNYEEIKSSLQIIIKCHVEKRLRIIQNEVMDLKGVLKAIQNDTFETKYKQ